MSRGQQASVLKQSTGVSNTYNADANTSFNTENQDLANEKSDIAGFAAANPYVQGGQAETVENQQLSDTSAGLAQSAGQAVQGAAVRTGQNSGAAIAATKDMEANNERALAGQEAGATDKRLGEEAGYGETVLGATSGLAGQQEGEAATQAGDAQGALNTEEQAAQTPSFLDTLGGSFAGAFGSALGKSAGS